MSHIALADLIDFEKKILSLKEILDNRANLPKPLVFTNGVFDILHRGHITYLAQARSMGNFLLVGINSDRSVKTLGKGKDRPLNCEADRAALIAALASVDGVVLFDESNPHKLIECLKPDILVKGGDYNIDALPEAATVRQYGGKALSIDFKYIRSTTALVNRIRQS